MRFQSVTFDCAEAVLRRGVKVVVFTMGGLKNYATNPEFEAYRAEIYRNILAGQTTRPIANDPILRGFRDLHTQAGFSNRNFPAASESLLEYLLKNQRLPQVNLLVDLYNLVSVETRLSLGAHDLANISGNVHLRMTAGAERFWPLGTPEPKTARPGGYAYIDDDNEVICFLEVKQVEKTKVTTRTTECLFIVQGNAATEWNYIHRAADTLISLIQRFCEGQARLLYPDGAELAAEGQLYCNSHLLSHTTAG